jgi:hypothetical protein
MSDVRTEPPRTTVIKWLRVNLAVTMAVFTIVSGAGGMVVGGTWRVSKYDSRFTDLEEKVRKIEEREVKRAVQDENEARSAQADIHERDMRRIKLAQDLGEVYSQLRVLRNQVDDLVGSRDTSNSVRERVSVLESKIQTLADGLRDTYGALSKAANKR